MEPVGFVIAQPSSGRNGWQRASLDVARPFAACNSLRLRPNMLGRNLGSESGMLCSVAGSRPNTSPRSRKAKWEVS